MEYARPQKGRKTSYLCSPAPRHQCHLEFNGRISFTLQHNDSNTQFHNIIVGYESVNRLSDDIVQSLVPHHLVAGVDCEYLEVLI